jgi:hypothetical protein
MSKHGHLIVLLAACMAGLACVPCGGDERRTVTLNANFHPDDGGADLTGEQTLMEGFDFGDGEGVWWEGAIRDASRVTAAIGTFTVGSPERTLALALPFPLTSAQVLTVVTTSTPSFGGDGFGSSTGRDISLFPAGAATLGYSDLPRPPCSREMPEACEAERAFKAQQVASGTLTVVSVHPLALRIDATVSFPAESGWAPEAISGTIAFAARDGEYCYNP